MSSAGSDLRRRLLCGALNLLDPRRRRVLAWRALEGQGARSITFERNGVVWTTGTEMMGFYLFADDGYQAAEIAALSAWMVRHDILNAARDVFVDVGANIGTTCIPVVLETGCRAVAIEPVEANFRLLCDNIGANRIQERVMPVKKAVLRAAVKTRMALCDFNSGGNYVYRDGALGGDGAGREPLEDVEGDGLLAILESVGVAPEQVAVVWADVQGCELEVIESGAKLWQIGVPLWAEIEPASLALQGALSTFAQSVAVHFDRYIASADLLRLGRGAPLRPIASMVDFLATATTTDALLLPPSFVDGSGRPSLPKLEPAVR